MIKEKPCKGRGMAKGYGCGELGLHHSMQKGLCLQCWTDWLINSEPGQLYLQKTSLKAKRKIEHERKEVTRQKKRELMSVNQYRATILQPIINEIARLIDFGQPCISTGDHHNSYDAGHYYSTGSNPNIALNLHNIHLQSVYANQHMSGMPREYFQGLIRVYGPKYAMLVSDLKVKYKNQTISKIDMMEVEPKAKRVRNWLRKNKAQRTPTQRMRLRHIINNYFNLY
jgi:hypothetical protein